jgi:hypothetical protein
MVNPSELLKAAEDLARKVESWADLSNALFDPMTGLLAQACPTRSEREAFAQTPEYQKIKALLAESQDRFGLVAGATPKRGVSLLVRLPHSLHAALEREAVAEGVGLDQLVVTKLAVNLQALVAAR